MRSLLVAGRAGMKSEDKGTAAAGDHDVHSSAAPSLKVSSSSTRCSLPPLLTGRDLHSALDVKAAGSDQRLFSFGKKGRRVAFEVAKVLNYLHSRVSSQSRGLSAMPQLRNLAAKAAEPRPVPAAPGQIYV